MVWIGVISDIHSEQWYRFSSQYTAGCGQRFPTVQYIHSRSQEGVKQLKEALQATLLFCETYRIYHKPDRFSTPDGCAHVWLSVLYFTGVNLTTMEMVARMHGPPNSAEVGTHIVLKGH